MRDRANHPLYKVQRQLKEARLVIVAELYKKGYSYSKIRTEVMARLGLATYSKRTVFADVHTLLKEWKEERLKDIDDLMTLELKRIDDIIVELWEQWERSKNEYTKKTQKQTGVPTGEGDGSDGGGNVATLKVERSKTTEEQLGDPRYIAEIRQQLVERRKLLGLYAPEKKEVKGDVSLYKAPSEMTVEEIEAELKALNLNE